MTLRRLGIARSASLTVVGLLAACSSGSVENKPAEPLGAVASAFSTSATHAKVPRDLLVAIAKVEDGLELPAERATLDVDNEVPAAGPLQLRRGKLDTLRRASELSGTTELDLRRHSDLALDAGALVLAELGAKTGARTEDLASWSAAVDEMSGFSDDAHRENYVHQVFATLARGGRFTARDGEVVVLAPHDLPPSLTLDVSSKLRLLAGEAQYDDAEWIPTSCTNKCNPTRGGAKVEFVVVHDTEGNWNASVATLQNDPNKSVQYIIDVTGRVGQFVTEEVTAWHGGNSSFNARSIGIEHVGYATKPFAEAEYVASAKLVDHLTTKYDIPRDRAHIIGHDQIPNGNKIAKDSPPCALSPTECQKSLNYGGASKHTDPGIWEWATFMPRFRGNAKCNDVAKTWTCSNDKTQAFRCAGDTVELQTCDGAGACEAGSADAGDADDVCNVAPKSTPDPVPPPPAKTADPPPPEPVPPPPAADTGCSVGPMTSSAGFGSGLGVGLGLLVLRLRRRRSPTA
jgi:N-acetyl-anhydromuramyl-L-alanine amidase AmpD